jgi:hypothetical protein
MTNIQPKSVEFGKKSTILDCEKNQQNSVKNRPKVGDKSAKLVDLSVKPADN